MKIMRGVISLIVCIASFFALPANARTVISVTIVEEWVDDAGGRFTAVDPAPIPQGIARFGPFRVIDPRRAALVDATDARSPRAFAAMMRAYPQITMLEMVECPGTDDDTANLMVGRMIRAAGLITHVPAHGSVRSGAVELFLAGKERWIDDGAEFAVHSWQDNYGREARDFAADSPVNRAYVDYYQSMGMSAPQARAFYDMTNSTPNADARWLTAQDMRGWIGQGSERQRAVRYADVTTQVTAPKIAYLDLGRSIP
ncbi:alpha/beta hydrolase [Tsuneonella suprasediminis]|uniref:alpha/beta hydrolase n=1 Tax=Tsuneonella suprasediminis TaxID=2306996 RepID=UPI002F938CD0